MRLLVPNLVRWAKLSASGSRFGKQLHLTTFFAGDEEEEGGFDGGGRNDKAVVLEEQCLMQRKL
jgi:hypothetical protein